MDYLVTPPSIFIVDTLESFEKLKEYVRSIPRTPVVLDVETDSKSEKRAKLYGIGLSFQDHEAFYIPIRKKTTDLWWTRDVTDSIAAWLQSLLRDRQLIGHNVIYDVLVIENNFGYDLSKYIYSDTILLKHTLDEERPHGLKETAVKYLGPWADKAAKALYENIKANGGTITKENLEMYKADTDVLSEYCCWDTLLTRQLFNIFEPRLKEEGLSDLFYKDEIMNLYREVTIDMKRKGFTVDVAYFQELQQTIGVEINRLEDEIISDLIVHTSEYEQKVLNENYPVKTTGNFPKALAEMLSLTLPINKLGKITMAKKAVEEQAILTPHWFFDWVTGKIPFSEHSIAYETQLLMFQKDNPNKRYVFNLKSNDHLAWLIFDRLGETPLSHTETGKPRCDDDYLASIKDLYDFVPKLVDLKKLIKLSSTYIEGILDRQIDGIIYTSMLQFGTTSGRYSSSDPNLQNIPRIKDEEAALSALVLKYTNAIKKGFIAPKGYKIVNADYASLEPVCFAHASGDERLREVFRKGYDLYSAIAIEVFNLEGFSADKKAANYLKKFHPEKRQLAKTFCLAVVYGAEAGRISDVMGVDYKTAEEIIDRYLEAYPQLRRYMANCDYQANKFGYVKTDLGRVRHLPIAKELHTRWGDKLLNRRFVKQNDLGDIRYKYKNTLNNSKNFPIQATASHIVNRAMIAANRKFKDLNIDAYICMQVHDEITCIVKDDKSELVKKLLKEAMETTTTISVPLQAEPIIADNWADAK